MHVPHYTDITKELLQSPRYIPAEKPVVKPKGILRRPDTEVYSLKDPAKMYTLSSSVPTGGRLAARREYLTPYLSSRGDVRIVEVARSDRSDRSRSPIYRDDLLTCRYCARYQCECAEIERRRRQQLRHERDERVYSNGFLVVTREPGKDRHRHRNSHDRHRDQYVEREVVKTYVDRRGRERQVVEKWLERR